MMIAFEEMAQAAESLRNTDPQTVPAMSAGDTWWQGDCGLQYLGVLDVPKNAISLREPYQLAEGQSEGSRHMATGSDLRFAPSDSPGLFGGVIFAPRGLTVTHPVHGDVTLEEPGAYLVRFQQRLVADQRGQLVPQVRARD